MFPESSAVATSGVQPASFGLWSELVGHKLRFFGRGVSWKPPLLLPAEGRPPTFGLWSGLVGFISFGPLAGAFPGNLHRSHRWGFLFLEAPRLLVPLLAHGGQGRGSHVWVRVSLHREQIKGIAAQSVR